MSDSPAILNPQQARELGQMVREWRGEVQQSPGSRLKRTGACVARFRVKSVQDDYITCRTWDGTTEGTTDVKVAKPYTLRKTPLHGKTLTINGNVLAFNYTGVSTRIVTKGTATQTQIIVPGYIATGTGYGGHEIWAVIGIGRGTGVVLNPGANEERIVWQDLNLDGRYWAKQ